jgi:hypothetical protein
VSSCAESHRHASASSQKAAEELPRNSTSALTIRAQP